MLAVVLVICGWLGWVLPGLSDTGDSQGSGTVPQANQEPSVPGTADAEPEESAQQLPGLEQLDAATLAALPGEPTPASYLGAVDGDTITTDLGTVRIIGIDTPERGECGYASARANIERVLAPGDAILLIKPPRQSDTDRYQRKLRFVFTADATRDVGLAQLADGHAVARYNSSDGYPKHPLEAEYSAAQVAQLGADGMVHATTCALSDRPATGYGDSGAVQPEGEWFVRYPSCAAVKRNTVGDPKGPFRVTEPAEEAAYQWFAFGTGYRGDGDGDGIACE